MTAVDTNVMVRLLTGDHAKQTASARSILAAGPIWVAKTVLLETAWVLRSLYGYDERAVRNALIKFLGLTNVQSEDAQEVFAALSLTEGGVEFADALHLCSRPPNSAFVTFDRRFVRRASRAGAKKITLLQTAN